MEAVHCLGAKFGQEVHLNVSYNEGCPTVHFQTKSGIVDATWIQTRDTVYIQTESWVLDTTWTQIWYMVYFETESQFLDAT